MCPHLSRFLLLSSENFKEIAWENTEDQAGFALVKGALAVNISLVVEFQRWWVLKSKVFGQESTYSKEIVVFYEYKELRFVKMPKSYFQS